MYIMKLHLKITYICISNMKICEILRKKEYLLKGKFTIIHYYLGLNLMKLSS